MTEAEEIQYRYGIAVRRQRGPEPISFEALDLLLTRLGLLEADEPEEASDGQ